MSIWNRIHLCLWHFLDVFLFSDPNEGNLQYAETTKRFLGLPEIKVSGLVFFFLLRISIILSLLFLAFTLGFLIRGKKEAAATHGPSI